MSLYPVALITGASRGIGRGIALELAALNTHRIIINYVGNEAAAKETAEACHGAGELPMPAEILQGDISLEADRARMVDFVGERFGRLDLLVNNAGIAPDVRADILVATEASFDRLIGVNLKGPYFLTQRAAALMMASAPLPGVARAVVNVTSISAFTASVNRGDYCVAKAGLSMMTKLYAARLAREGISVFEVQPGVIATDMTGGVRRHRVHLQLQRAALALRRHHPRAALAGAGAPAGALPARRARRQGLPAGPPLRPRPRHRPLRRVLRRGPRRLRRARIPVEHAIAGAKRCRRVLDTLRNWRRGFADEVMVAACGLHNLRVASRQAA